MVGRWRLAKLMYARSKRGEMGPWSDTCRQPVEQHCTVTVSIPWRYTESDMAACGVWL